MMNARAGKRAKLPMNCVSNRIGNPTDARTIDLPELVQNAFRKRLLASLFEAMNKAFVATVRATVSANSIPVAIRLAESNWIAWPASVESDKRFNIAPQTKRYEAATQSVISAGSRNVRRPTLGLCVAWRVTLILTVEDCI